MRARRASLCKKNFRFHLHISQALSVADSGGRIEMKYELDSSRHSVHLLTYHVVWCTKYRRTVLSRLFQEFPVIKNRLWGGHLWSPSYFVVTVGGAPLEAIRKYVEQQRTKGYGQKQNDKRKSK